jgi:zinc protease
MLFLILACARHLPAPPPDSDLLSNDPLVEQGKLSNGLSWYIQKTQEPAQRAELRLVINAGSVLEDDDQLGLAHCLEHMAFNGSAHFSGNDLIHYFESIGMSFGAHVNAYTSFDETVYTLTIPTDNADALDKGLLVLRDQAGSLTLDPKEIEKERGVVLEEWRQGLNAQHRISEHLLPFELHGSHYADRLPIGTPESIQKFDPSALQRFYHDWYRPDLMAVMVVGDMDPQAAQALVEKYFSDLQNPSPERERVRYPLPPHPPVSRGP